MLEAIVDAPVFKLRLVLRQQLQQPIFRHTSDALNGWQWQGKGLLADIHDQSVRDGESVGEAHEELGALAGLGLYPQ